MDVFIFGVVLGTAGLTTMAFSGLAHRGHAGHDNDAGNVPLGHRASGGALTPGAKTAGAQSPLAIATRAPNALASMPRHPSVVNRVMLVVWAWLSPRVLFSVLVGFGATGLVLRALLGAHGFVLALALLGGVLFERALVRPLWNATLRFGSTPALTLDGCVAEPARAVTTFDAQGHGLVALELDGQVIQLLATLRREERASGIAVKSGETVYIDDVDTARNRCTVSRLRP